MTSAESEICQWLRAWRDGGTLTAAILAPLIAAWERSGEEED